MLIPADQYNEWQYLRALKHTARQGDPRSTRNGWTKAGFVRVMTFKNIARHFPLLTTKFVSFQTILAELRWLVEGGKDTGYRLSLHRFNELLGKQPADRNIWTMDQERFAKAGKAQFLGDCGRIYGAQWRDWINSKGVHTDQLSQAIKRLREDPFSRYHIITAWNPGELDDMCLAPCHMKMQLFVKNPKKKGGKLRLSMSMDQRSCDMFLGEPFNIAFYALLLMMMAQCVDMEVDELKIILEDHHIYTGVTIKETGLQDQSVSHRPQVLEQLSRSPYPAPYVTLTPGITDIDKLVMAPVDLTGYKNHGKLVAQLL